MNIDFALPPALNGRKGEPPALPPGAPTLLRALHDDNIGIADIAELLERFPQVAARLIGLANSAWSAPASPIVSVYQACGRMGLDVVRSVAMGMTVTTPFNPRNCTRFDKERFWLGSLLSADIAANLATAIGPTCTLDHHSARTAGLLHNLGLLWLADRMPKETDAAIRHSDDTNTPLDETLCEACGIGYAAAGGYLCRLWDLPKVLIDAVEYHADPDYTGDDRQAARLVSLSKRIAESVVRERPWATGSARSEGLPVSPELERTIFQRAADRLESNRQLLKALFPN